jgi:hypothetical protein
MGLGYIHLYFQQREDLQHELDFLLAIGNRREWSQTEPLGIWRRMASVFKLMNSAFDLS